jgi:Phage integrase family.
MNLRPNLDSERFFVNFQNGKCTRQLVGINKLGNMPRKIATFLKLPNAAHYTGHCFRRTSATILVDSGADITTLKRHGGWKSTSVAEGYIDNSLKHKMDVANKIALSINPDLPIVLQETIESIDQKNQNEHMFTDVDEAFKTNDCTTTNNHIIIKDTTNNVSHINMKDSTNNMSHINISKIPSFTFNNCNVTINMNK